MVGGSRGGVCCLLVLHLKCVHRQTVSNLSFMIRQPSWFRKPMWNVLQENLIFHSIYLF